jgi:hypothetical protein
MSSLDPQILDRQPISKYRAILRGKAYDLRKADLLERDGPVCQNCKRTFPDDELLVHHKNGNQYDQRLSNTELNCRPCNTTESNQRRAALKISTDQREKEKQRQAWPISGIAWEGKRHLQLEVDYEKSLDQLLDQGPVTVGEALDRLAKITGSTQQTANWWLRRETTKEGSFTVSERQVSDGRKTWTEQYISRKRIPE